MADENASTESTETAKTATPTPTPTAVETGVVKVSQKDFDNLTARLKSYEEADANRTKEEADRKQAAEAQAKKERDEKAKAEGRYQELIDEGNKSLAEKDRMVSELSGKLRSQEQITASSIAQRDLLAELPTSRLVDHGSRQLMALLSPHVECKIVDGEWTTRAKDGTELAAFVKTQLEKPEYAHFLRADVRATVGGRGNGTNATNAGGNPEHQTEGHRMVAQAQERNRLAGRNTGMPVGSHNYKSN